MKNKILSLVILSSLSIPVFASNISTQPKATATLASACKISAIDVPFGVITPTSTSNYVFQNGNIAVLCSNNLSYTMTFNQGIAVFYRNRHMEALSAHGNIDQIKYDLYQDLSYSKPFGDGTDGTFIFTNTGNGTTQNIPVYGRLNTNLYITPDNYGDTITVTVSY